jgi:hypothetical protein
VCTVESAVGNDSEPYCFRPGLQVGYRVKGRAIRSPKHRQFSPETSQKPFYSILCNPPSWEHQFRTQFVGLFGERFEKSHVTGYEFKARKPLKLRSETLQR